MEVEQKVILPSLEEMENGVKPEIQEIEKPVVENQVEVEPELEKPIEQKIENEPEPEPEKVEEKEDSPILSNLEEILKSEIESPLNDEELPEVKEAKELKTIIESDSLLKDYLEARKAGKSFKEFVEVALVPDYSTDDPERVFKDYMLKENPNLTQDELNYEYDAFKGDDERLTSFKLTTIRNWAKELNESKPKPNWGVDSQARQEMAAKALEVEKQTLNELKGLVIGGRKNELGKVEGGFVFNDNAIKNAEKVANAIRSGQFLNPDGTPKKQLIEMVAVYSNIKDIVNTISKSSAAEAKVEVLSKAANLRSPSGTAPSPTMSKTTPVSTSQQFAEARKVLGLE